MSLTPRVALNVNYVKPTCSGWISGVSFGAPYLVLGKRGKNGLSITSHNALHQHPPHVLDDTTQRPGTSHVAGQTSSSICYPISGKVGRHLCRGR